jgi:hypothetical protein
MKPLKEVISQIIETALTNPEQAKTMLASLHCNNIALVEYKASIFTCELNKEEKLETSKGTLWINTDVDPELQVYYHLISYYRSSNKPMSTNLKNIEVEGIEEWEKKWADWNLSRRFSEDIIETVEIHERSDDTRPTEVDSTESGESDGILSVDNGGEQAHQEPLS